MLYRYTQAFQCCCLSTDLLPYIRGICRGIFIHVFLVIACAWLGITQAEKCLQERILCSHNWKHFISTFPLRPDTPLTWVTAPCAPHSYKATPFFPSPPKPPYFHPLCCASHLQERCPFPVRSWNGRISSSLVRWSLVKLGTDHETELLDFGLLVASSQLFLPPLPTLHIQQELHRKVFHADLCTSPCRLVQGADREGWMTE